jgi:hypothetical protein
LQLLQVEQSATYRANIVVAEVDGKSATVEMKVYVADGRSATKFVELQPFQFVQLGSMLAGLGLDNAANARISIRVIGGQGRVSGYASVIDNRTQDPTYIPAQ